MKHLTLAGAFLMLGAPAFADAAAGLEVFNRQCATCHVVVNDAGETLAGRNANTGPNLYGVIGRTPGTYPDFEYGESLVEYGATGVVWEEENFLAYVQDPTDFLRTALDNRRARGKMAFQVRDAADAESLYAYLSTVVPAQ